MTDIQTDAHTEMCNLRVCANHVSVRGGAVTNRGDSR
jgi:hypothetical protein